MTVEAAASPFDPTRQNQPPHLGHKLVAGLERLSGVFRHLLWEEATRRGLSPLQLQLLVFLRFHRPAQCTGSYLAREYHVSRATISEAVKTLVHKQLVRRHLAPADLRRHYLQLTPAGEQLADQAAGFAEPLGVSVAGLPARQQQVLYQSVLTLLQQLQRGGTIPVQRMCFSCRYYEPPPPGGHFCHLLRLPLEAAQLRLDCPDHEAAPR